MQSSKFQAAIAAVALAACAAGAETQVSGSWTANDAVSTRRANFSCSGSPVCTGIVTIRVDNAQCSNGITLSADVALSGLDLSHAGPLNGVYAMSRRACFTANANGTCTWNFTPQVVWSFTGNWDGGVATMAISSLRCDGNPLTRLGSFTAIAGGNSPVFPMTVASSINMARASANAQVQPRPEDYGRTVGFYVFAHAPSTLMQPGHPAPCVLAQVNAQGKLAAVTAASMTPALGGTFSSQAQAVTILNNAATPDLAGAAFFVGYGGSATEMLSAGRYQGAFTVPGETQCSTSLASAPVAQSPGPATGLFWNAAESGWGVHLTQRGANMFVAWYTYDAAGKAKWYVAPNCTRVPGTSGDSAACNGTLYDVTAAGFFGTAFDPARVSAAPAGNIQLTFSGMNNANFTYTVGAQARTVAVVRQPLSSDPRPLGVDYTDLWWNPSESGWGMAIAQQGGIAFLAWYVYDANGKPSWLVATCPMNGSSCSGTLYRTQGPALGSSFNAALVQATAVGTIAVVFTDANTGVVTFTVDGVGGSKGITRQVF